MNDDYNILLTELIPRNKIYIIGSNKEEKPIKITIESDEETTSVKRKLTENEIREKFIKLLQNLWSQHIINTQQYRSTKGQIKHKYTVDAIRFVTRLGYIEKYEDILNKEINEIVFRKQIPIIELAKNITLGVINNVEE